VTLESMALRPLPPTLWLFIQDSFPRGFSQCSCVFIYRSSQRSNFQLWQARLIHELLDLSFSLMTIGMHRAQALLMALGASL
jgi:hypothetical protein